MQSAGLDGLFKGPEVADHEVGDEDKSGYWGGGCLSRGPVERRSVSVDGEEEGQLTLLDAFQRQAWASAWANVGFLRR